MINIVIKEHNTVERNLTAVCVFQNGQPKLQIEQSFDSKIMLESSCFIATMKQFFCFMPKKSLILRRIEILVSDMLPDV